MFRHFFNYLFDLFNIWFIYVYLINFLNVSIAEIPNKVQPVKPTSKVVKDDGQANKTVKALSPSAVDNDPLADLLK